MDFSSFKILGGGGYFEIIFKVPPRYAEPSFNVRPGTLKL